jgi:hypothetical protein
MGDETEVPAKAGRLSHTEKMVIEFMPAYLLLCVFFLR